MARPVRGTVASEQGIRLSVCEPGWVSDFFYHDRAIHPFFVKRKIVISTPVCDHASEEPS